MSTRQPIQSASTQEHPGSAARASAVGLGAGAGVAAVATVADQHGVPAVPADGTGGTNWAAGTISAGAAGPAISLQAGVAASPTVPAGTMWGGSAGPTGAPIAEQQSGVAAGPAFTTGA
jgi:hypothetical protein